MTDFSSMTSREIFDAVKAQEDVALIAEAITALSSRRGDDISGFIGYLGRGSSDEGLIRLTLDSLKQRPDNTARCGVWRAGDTYSRADKCRGPYLLWNIAWQACQGVRTGGTGVPLLRSRFHARAASSPAAAGLLSA